ncbi:MAG TPA: hypothetical protein DEQ02_09395 [Ruminococcaceae bacterium]|nr:hypothetical protein [Oscillospiraceae bacterium]
MDINTILELSAIVKSQGLTALEVDENGVRIRLENDGGAKSAFIGSAVTASPASIPAPQVSEQAQPDKTEDDSSYTYVKAPMVGIFRSLEKMGKKPLEAGVAVSPDTVVCGIEAMKMVCDVKAECPGIFVETLASDGEQVEFGQELIRLTAN